MILTRTDVNRCSSPRNRRKSVQDPYVKLGYWRVRRWDWLSTSWPAGLSTYVISHSLPILPIHVSTSSWVARDETNGLLAGGCAHLHRRQRFVTLCLPRPARQRGRPSLISPMIVMPKYYLHGLPGATIRAPSCCGLEEASSYVELRRRLIFERIGVNGRVFTAENKHLAAVPGGPVVLVSTSSYRHSFSPLCSSPSGRCCSAPPTLPSVHVCA